MIIQKGYEGGSLYPVVTHNYEKNPANIDNLPFEFK